MKKQLHLIQALTALLIVALSVIGCTKKRDAALPEEQARSIFAISDFGSVEGLNSPFSIETDSQQIELGELEKVKADNEVGKVEVTRVEAPERLRYMFKNLKVSGQAQRKMPITFSVDRRFVTAYKVVTQLEDLSPLEKQYAKIKEEVQLSVQIARSQDKAARSRALTQLQKVRDEKAFGRLNNAVFLVPIFKYQIRSYGVLERQKNSLKEETSTLTLRSTDWENATHIEIAHIKDAAVPVDVNANDREELERTYSLNRLQNRVMSAGDLEVLYQIRVDLDKKAQVHTLVDDSGLSVFQLKKKSELTEAEAKTLASGDAGSGIEACSAKVLASIGKQNADDCVSIHKFIVPVRFVKMKMPMVSHEGEEDAQMTFEEVNFAKNSGLVQVPRLVEPKRVTKDFIPDSTSVIKVEEVKGREFFFRRTLQDAPVTTAFMPGEADQLLIVRFNLEDNRLVVKRAEGVINHKKGSNEVDKEEIMSIPVDYYRRENVDSAGNALAYARFVKTNKDKAEYIQLNWSANSLSEVYSPIAHYGGGRCIRQVGNVSIEGVDNRLKTGILSFTYGYSASLAAEESCLGIYQGFNTYDPSGLKVQFNASLKERVSFLANDGRTETKLGVNLPFEVQRSLGFGVWTLGKLNPTENGAFGREGTQDHLNVKHDFRNGRTLDYVVTGLPKDDLRKRDLYIETVREVVSAWNFAYAQAFKGTALERKNNTYVTVRFADEDNINAQLGDLDKNIIHFENKYNDNHGVLGVSQVGYNPRTGVVVADSLIIYAGNLAKYVENGRRSLLISQQWQKQREERRENALVELKNSDQKQVSNAHSNADADSQISDKNSQQILIKLSNLANEIRLVSGSSRASQGGQLLTDKRASQSLSLGKLGSSRSSIKLQTLKNSAQSKFKSAPSSLENSYIERTLLRMAEADDVSTLDIEGVLAEEMLKSLGKKLSHQQRSALSSRASLGKIRTQMKNRFKNTPGCMLTTRDSLNVAYAGDDFYKSLKRALYFDLAHEMGHSQGLTHNFAGSFDKTNFNLEGEKSQRNYTTVMDYIDPAHFSWDGIGTYDIRALRATHTGMIEKSNQADGLLNRFGLANAIKGSNLDLNIVSNTLNQRGWSQVPNQLFALSVKPFKYCTDVDVHYEPTCQRFDLGTTATEVVQNIIRDYDELYINGFHAWDRIEFGYINKVNAVSASMNMMFQMRQFLDEYYYKTYVEGAPQAVVEDYRNAAMLALNFFNNLIRTPTQSAAFMDERRFKAVDLIVEEPVLNQQGAPVLNQDGSVSTKSKKDVIIVEYKPLQDIMVSSHRIDTIGILDNKIMAMQMLTMQGFPHHKYAQVNLSFNFLDLDQEISGKEPSDLLTVQTLRDSIRGQLEASYMLPSGDLVSLGETLESSDIMRIYGAMSSILNLESPALRQEDNYANLFKVGSSIGATPRDRTSVGAMDIKESSSTRVNYWALDKASVSSTLVEELRSHFDISKIGSAEMAGAELNALIASHMDLSIGSLLKSVAKTRQDSQEQIAINKVADEKLANIQNRMNNALTQLAMKIAQLAQKNKSLQQAGIVDAKSVQEVTLLMNSMVKNIVETNILTGYAINFIPQQQHDRFFRKADEVRREASKLAEASPIMGAVIQAVNTHFADEGNKAQQEMAQLESTKTKLSNGEMIAFSVDKGSIVIGANISSQLFKINMSDINYSRSLRIVDFLNKLTIMTNPELNR